MGQEREKLQKFECIDNKNSILGEIKKNSQFFESFTRLKQKKRTQALRKFVFTLPLYVDRYMLLMYVVSFR